jgi:hypothetical protein
MSHHTRVLLAATYARTDRRQIAAKVHALVGQQTLDGALLRIWTSARTQR